MHVRHPIWSQALAAPGATAFAALFALESFTRSIIATVIPLQVLSLLGEPAKVSLLFFAVSLAGLCVNFTIPLLVRAISRRFTYSLGALATFSAALLLAEGSLLSTSAGILLRVFGVACFAICLNLYILDYLRGRDLNRMEPLRLVYAASAWTVGPALGVLLWTQIGHWVPYAVSAVSAFFVLGYFWLLRASDNRLLIRASGKPPTPFGNIARYFRQPRLRLAWLIAATRSSWWVMFFIYTPIFAVETGLGAEVGGLLVSAGNALLFAAPLLGRLAGRKGVRWMLLRAFICGGLLTLAVALLAFLEPAAAAAVLLLAAVAAVALDVVGNIPFLRSVMPSQRAAMTTVFVSYRDVSEVAPPAVLALILKLLPLPFVFVASGLSLLVAAWYARYVPRRL